MGGSAAEILVRTGKPGAAPGEHHAGEYHTWVQAPTSSCRQEARSRQEPFLQGVIPTLEEGCRPVCSTDTPLGTGFPTKRKRQGIVLLLLVFKHPDGLFAVTGRDKQGIGMWLLHVRHKAKDEDGELRSVQDWDEHVCRKGLSTDDSHNMLHFHDPV